MESAVPGRKTPLGGIIDRLSEIIGMEDIAAGALPEKCKEIKNWDTILKHQKLLTGTLGRNISIEAAVLDYILSSEDRFNGERTIGISSPKKKVYTTIIDPVTGLYNERHFQTILSAELKRAKGHSLPLTLFIMDVDDFGMYADIMGREAGNTRLNEIGIILKKHCRKSDMLFRLNKGRFSAVLLNAGRSESHKIAQRLKKAAGYCRFKREEKCPSGKLTLSGGIAVYPEDGKHAHILISAAEEALNTAKQSGGDRILEYSAKRRKSRRINIKAKARYQIEGRRDLRTREIYIKNMSETGALISAPGSLPLGGSIIITFKLPGGKTIRIKSTAVRISATEGKEDTIIALKFRDMPPSDMFHLRNYINLNLQKENRENNV